MARTTPLARSSVFLVCLAMTGCQELYLTETIVHPDGSVRRAVYQPLEKTPVSARDPKVWDQVTFAPSPETLNRRGWPASIIEFPRRASTEGLDYFVAWKEARSVQDLPDHVIMKAPEGVKVPDGRLAREYVRTDYGFVIEHRWRETLTDCVSPEDMRQARGELAALAIDLADDVFRELHGDEYDTSGLVSWLRTEGTAWFEELTDSLFARAPARGGVGAEDQVKAELAKICARHGLVLTDGERLVSEAEILRRIEAFATNLVQGRLKRKDGGPVERAEVERLLAELKSEDRTGARPSRIDGALERVAARKYGGKAALERRFGTLLVRVVGLYQLPFADSRFDATLTLPGEVVETNGQILSASRVRWQFEASRAYPFGYTMECRSIATDPEALALLPGKPLADRAAMLRFIDLVADVAPLRDALRACRAAKSLKPLSDYRKRVLAEPKSAAEVAALYRLKAMLGLSFE